MISLFGFQIKAFFPISEVWGRYLPLNDKNFCIPLHFNRSPPSFIHPYLNSYSTQCCSSTSTGHRDPSWVLKPEWNHSLEPASMQSGHLHDHFHIHAVMTLLTNTTCSQVGYGASVVSVFPFSALRVPRKKMMETSLEQSMCRKCGDIMRSSLWGHQQKPFWCVFTLLLPMMKRFFFPSSKAPSCTFKAIEVWL